MLKELDRNAEIYIKQCEKLIHIAHDYPLKACESLKKNKYQDLITIAKTPFFKYKPTS